MTHNPHARLCRLQSTLEENGILRKDGDIVVIIIRFSAGVLVFQFFHTV